MANRFTLGARAISECDRCGIRVKLKDLKNLVIKTKRVSIKVCNECWEADHPQLQLGMYPVADPQAVRDPRPDFAGYVESRDIQWGWNPVGGSSQFDAALTPNNLVSAALVGQTSFDTTLVCTPYEITTNTTTAGPITVLYGCYANVYDAAVWTIT